MVNAGPLVAKGSLQPALMTNSAARNPENHSGSL